MNLKESIWLIAMVAVLLVRPACVLEAQVQSQTQTQAQAQAPAGAELARLTAARNRVGAMSGTIWPSFRTDTIPLQVVLPNRGTLLLGWTGARPAGYTEAGSSTPALWQSQAARGAASTATLLNERLMAQIVVTDTSAAALSGLIAHESFHAFEQSVRSAKVKFGNGENSFYVSRYPVYDVANESRFALELAVLGDALTARTAAEARTSATQFLAIRDLRQQAMDGNVATFEAMTELNEGLAEYALVRAAAAAPGGTSATAATVARLSSLLSAVSQSVRLRFYVTGAGQALLLDRIGPSDWKTRLMQRDVTLAELLAEAVGYTRAVDPNVAEAERRHDPRALEAAAIARVNALRTRVRARADSMMSRPGLQIVLDGSQVGLPTCGFDPQNMLQLGDGAVLHTRWLRVCKTGIELEFNAPIVQTGNTYRAVIGLDNAVRITSAGKTVSPVETGEDYSDVKIESPGLSGTIARARITRTPGGLSIVAH